MHENIAAVLFSYIKPGKFFECANKEKIISPEQNAERRINKGKSGLKIFLYHYKGIETADRMSYN